MAVAAPVQQGGVMCRGDMGCAGGHGMCRWRCVVGTCCAGKGGGEQCREITILHVRAQGLAAPACGRCKLAAAAAILLPP